ncbi:MAG: hypothetical protein ACYC6B_01350 [Thermoleophilia bacterium]
MKTGVRAWVGRKTRIFAAIAAPLVLAVVLALAFGGGISVGQSGYGIMDVSPSSACVGSPVTFSGTLSPGSSVRLSMYMLPAERPYYDDALEKCGSYGGPCGAASQVSDLYALNGYSTDFGSTTAGPDGGWALTVWIPAMVERDFGGTVATPAGVWNVAAADSGSGPYSLYSHASGNLTVLDCSGSLPVTGFPRPLAAIIIVLVSSAGIGLIIVSRRRRLL